MILVIEGIGARLIAEAWGRKDELGCVWMDGVIGMTDEVKMSNAVVDETRTLVLLDANHSSLDVYVRLLIDLVQRRIVTPESTSSPRILMLLSSGIASLPLPGNVESLAVCISLEHKIEFLREDEVEVELEDAQDEDAGETWASGVWRPACNALLQCLSDMPKEDSALVLSVLKMGCT